MSRRIPREEVGTFLKARAKRAKKMARRVRLALLCTQSPGTCFNVATHIGLYAFYCDKCLLIGERPMHLVRL